MPQPRLDLGDARPRSASVAWGCATGCADRNDSALIMAAHLSASLEPDLMILESLPKAKRCNAATATATADTHLDANFD